MSGWSGPIAAGLEGLARKHPAASVFFEDREDVRIEARSGAEPRVIRTRNAGAAFAFDPAAGHHVHLADPDPEGFEGWARAGADPGSVGRIASTRSTSHPARLDSAPALDVFRVLSEAAATTGMHYVARWVEVEQHVTGGGGSSGRFDDVRKGARLRIEVHRGGEAAVVDAVRRPGRTMNPAALLRTAFDRAEVRRGATAVAPGSYPAVFAAGVGGVLIHELVGHALEGDTVGACGTALRRDDASFHEAGVEVVDDPRRGRVPWMVDDEGTPAVATPLIRRGRVVGVLHDRRTATEAGDAPTGHGRRSSYLDPVRPRMGCTFLTAGRLHPADMHEGISEGLFVHRMEAASVDPTSGAAEFRVTDANRIENGRVDRPLRPFLLRVTLADTLTTLDRIAYDLAFDTCVGSCLRSGQPLAMSVGAPTFRIGVTRVPA